MFQLKTKITCDCCKLAIYKDLCFISEEVAPGVTTQTNELQTPELPDGWINMQPFGDLCNKCYGEILDLYGRMKRPNPKE